MALEEYRKKRDFSQTPEPAGKVEKRAAKARFFCVQKHLASHLHYDFRLEHNGVLLSWAVPKGPSLDPSTKRLAMQVEDHPLEYGEFEGVIPSGYGAGIVMLWDQGTWTPEVDDVEAALRKGDLKITLNGYKLKGSWVLVRTRGWGSSSRDTGRSWLLIKHRDEWAGEVDIAEFAPASVKSGGDFADILASDRPEIWVSHRPAQTGEAGKMFERIVARALEMRGTNPSESQPTPRTTRRRTTPAAATTRASKTAVAEKTAVARKTAGAGKTAGATKRATRTTARPAKKSRG